MPTRRNETPSQSAPRIDTAPLPQELVTAFSDGFIGRARLVQPNIWEHELMLVDRVSGELSVWDGKILAEIGRKISAALHKGSEEKFGGDDPRRSLYDLGDLLGKDYIQAHERFGRREITARTFQKAVRRISPDVLERTEILRRIASARGRRGVGIDFVFIPFLAELDYREPPIQPLGNGHVASRLADDPQRVILETPDAYRIRVYYHGAICADLEGRRFRAAEYGGGQEAKERPGRSDRRRKPSRKRSEMKPKWDRETGELRINDKLVKTFQDSAVNQESVMTAFEKKNWAEVVDSPFADEERKLQADTLRDMRLWSKPLGMNFRGTGRKTIRWEWVEPPAEN